MGASLAALNATLNATSAVLALVGWRMIRAGRVERHWRFMIGAVAASALFLVSYAMRMALTGTHRYPVEDWTRTLYLAILGTHTLLAPVVLVMVLVTLTLAARRRHAAHRRLARVTLPLWAYVSATGVAVYVMLYHVAPARLP